jgi:hypothetical protein
MEVYIHGYKIKERAESKKEINEILNQGNT